jgi:hypothetical protein
LQRKTGRWGGRDSKRYIYKDIINCTVLCRARQTGGEEEIHINIDKKKCCAEEDKLSGKKDRQKKI